MIMRLVQTCQALRMKAIPKHKHILDCTYSWCNTKARTYLNVNNCINPAIVPPNCLHTDVTIQLHVHTVGPNLDLHWVPDNTSEASDSQLYPQESSDWVHAWSLMDACCLVNDITSRQFL
jgi:hypothetical protein